MKFELKSLLIIGDILVAAISFYLASTLRFGIAGAKFDSLVKPQARVLIFIVVVLAASYIFDVYRLVRQRNSRDTIKKIIQSVCTSFLALSAIIFINPDWMIGRGLLAIALMLFVLLQFAWHWVFRTMFHLPYLSQKIIVVCTGEVAAKIAALIRSVEGVNHSLVGFITCGECMATGCKMHGEKVLGKVEDLLEIIARTFVTKIIIANPLHLRDDVIQHVLLDSKLQGIEIASAPAYYESVAGKLMLEHMDLHDMIYSDGFKSGAIVTAVKRVMDIVIALVGIILAIPLLPLLALLVKINAPGPILYSQIRVGYMGIHFKLYKFRTMSQNAELQTGEVWTQENDPRLKPIGRFLRKIRLDEIPQLYNVFIGEMSFVGPRPERPSFVGQLQELIPFYSKRFFVKPGLTGWAQIKFPYGASVDDAYEKLRYDLYYLKNISPILDTIIFFKTIKVVISQFGGR